MQPSKASWVCRFPKPKLDHGAGDQTKTFKQQQQHDTTEWHGDIVWRWQHEEASEWHNDIFRSWRQHEEATEWQGDIHGSISRPQSGTMTYDNDHNSTGYAG